MSAKKKAKAKAPAQPKSYRFFGVMNSFSLISLVSHVLFAFIFGWIELWELALYYAATSLIWLGIYLINKRGHHRLAFIAGVTESVIHAVFATFLLGWQSGFYLYLLVLTPLVFINAKMHEVLKTMLGVILAGLTITLFIITPELTLFQSIDYYLNILNILLVIMILGLIGHAFELSAENAEAELLLANRRLMNLATTDPVTNLTNRRNMMMRIEQEKDKIDHGGKPFALIMVDIDNFKMVNDEFGHDGGDFVLVELAEMISVSIRKQDQVARWGGDEFLILLPETDIEGGRVVAEKIRTRVMRSPFVYHENDIPVTLTFGVGLCDVNSGIGSTIRKADQALYFGKQAGKNRVATLN